MATRSKASSRLKRMVGWGAIAGALYALWRLLETRRRESGLDWQPQPFPYPPRPLPLPPDPGTDTHTQISRRADSPGESPDAVPAASESPAESPDAAGSGDESAAESADAAGSGGESPADSALPEKAVGWVEPADGACPATHPVKAKLGSGIYHAPGMQMYERTRADRCYADAASAEADGLRASKR